MDIPKRNTINSVTDEWQRPHQYSDDIKIGFLSNVFLLILRACFPKLLHNLDNVCIKQIGTGVVVTNIFFQKFLRVNSNAPFLIHYTSKCVLGENIEIENQAGSQATRVGLATAPNCYLQAYNSIKLGKDIFIGPGVKIISADHDAADFRKHQQQVPIKIENNVLLSANVIVLPGVTIGKNTLTGAASVITKSIPKDSVALGAPAKIKPRNTA